MNGGLKQMRGGQVVSVYQQTTPGTRCGSTCASRRRHVTGALAPMRFPLVKAVTAADTGNTQFEGAQLLIDADTHRQVLHGRMRLDLPPTTIFAKSPARIWHDQLLVLSGSKRCRSTPSLLRGFVTDLNLWIEQQVESWSGFDLPDPHRWQVRRANK
jgi:hypothetical protein